MKASEHEHQVAYFQWVRLKAKQNDDYKTIFAVPNGGKRSIGTARKLKAEGVTAGVPDVICPVPRDGWSGLFLEFKIKPNKLTEQQKAFAELMQERGHKYCVCYSWEEAKNQTEIYLGE